MSDDGRSGRLSRAYGLQGFWGSLEPHPYLGLPPAESSDDDDDDDDDGEEGEGAAAAEGEGGSVFKDGRSEDEAREAAIAELGGKVSESFKDFVAALQSSDFSGGMGRLRDGDGQGDGGGEEDEEDEDEAERVRRETEAEVMGMVEQGEQEEEAIESEVVGQQGLSRQGEGTAEVRNEGGESEGENEEEEDEDDEEEEDDDDTGAEWYSQDGEEPEVSVTITVDHEDDGDGSHGSDPREVYNCEVRLCVSSDASFDN